MTATCDCLMFWKFDVENICILLYAIIISYLQTLSTYPEQQVMQSKLLCFMLSFLSFNFHKNSFMNEHQKTGKLQNSGLSVI